MNSFQVKDLIDKGIYILFNLLSRLLFLFDFKTKKIIRSNRAFANKHKGERCFILGCGPSLKSLTEEQIAFLQHEIVIGVNELFRTSFLKNIIPHYYFLIDNAYWNEQWEVAKSAFENYKGKDVVFLSSVKAYNKIKSLDMPQLKVLYIFSRLYPINKIINVMDSNQTISMNVVTEAIITAMYMGFKEIYLLGCDYSAFATPLDTHCYDNENSPKKSENLAFFLKYYEIATSIHYLVAKKAIHDNVSIINLTNDSLLDAYPKKTFNDIINSK